MADTNAPAVDDTRTAAGSDADLKEAGDSPKRQGDKLGTAAADTATASETGVPGDSPKRQGDKLEAAVEAAAKS